MSLNFDLHTFVFNIFLVFNTLYLQIGCWQGLFKTQEQFYSATSTAAVLVSFGRQRKWSLGTLDRWSFYAVTIIQEFAWADSALVGLDEWSSYRGGRLNRFDCIAKKEIKEHNPNWTGISDHAYRILIGGFGSGKTCIT